MKTTLHATLYTNLKLAPKLQHAVKLLHLSSGELREYLQDEFESNPFIEDIVFKYTDSGLYNRGNNGRSADNIPARPMSLKEYLSQQINIALKEERAKSIALYLTHNIDDNGYLKVSTAQLADELQIGNGELEDVISLIQTKVDPVGAYSRNLKECLELQARARRVYDRTLAVLLDNLPLIASHNISKLADLCGINEERVRSQIRIIKTLDPKPGRNFDNTEVSSILPDVIIENIDGNFIANLNSMLFPDIIVNQELFDRSEHNTFCKNKLKEAKWLATTVRQRGNTVLRVAKEIISMQYQFMRLGTDYLKPMKLSDISRKLDLHPSTISRVANKYMVTPHGTFQFKYFFNAGLESSLLEEQYSSLAIKNKIKTLINEESQDNVLSDTQISSILKRQGIIISRRTVNKYRVAMQIPASSVRRRKLAMV